jgi:methionyl-tRNA formyltransferase
MMKILFCAYRDWAIKVHTLIQIQSKYQLDVTLVSNEIDLERAIAASKHWDAIIVVGWSWKIPQHIVKDYLVVGMHPSDMPEFRGGSPIQHQIMAGIEHTQATLFRLSSQFDNGQIIDKEPVNLQGHINDVFDSLTRVTQTLLLRFFENFPNNTYVEQNKGGSRYLRLKPENSQLSLNMSSITCKELWNIIRCHEDPYPNVYFEDETGKLIIKMVEFEPKKQ